MHLVRKPSGNENSADNKANPSELSKGIKCRSVRAKRKKVQLAEPQWALVRKTLLDFNKQAMHDLNFGRVQQSQELFGLLFWIVRNFKQTDKEMQCLTLNNLSWLYKRKTEFSKGLRMLKKALKIAQESEEKYLPLTYINLSAILSEMDR